MAKFGKFVSENAVVIWMTGAMRSYVVTMKELAENTLEDLKESKYSGRVEKSLLDFTGYGASVVN